ncbi:cytochrome P450 [Podospora didyma]|uniref:Cytochrome P450 n=1 Tax=Podospora didyma TaxID=330526 RepID=A0AAE0NPK0_9PEZI|nr:cytochrome P450 [Podospora didyma]
MSAMWYEFPFLAKFSYAWHVYYGLGGTGRQVFSDIHNKYADGGPFVRIAPNYVITNDPEVLRRIASARTRYVRDEWYKAAQFHREFGNMASILENEPHEILKAKTASAYSGRENGADFEPAIDSQIAALVSLIQRKYLTSTAADGSSQPAELSLLMRFFTMDLISRLGYGESGARCQLLRNLMWERFGLMGLFGPSEADKADMGPILSCGFIRHGLTKQEVLEEATLQLVAGSETTATALLSTIMYLATSPLAYVRFKREIRHAIDSGLVAADSAITYEQAQKPPYLQAVIWEGFRMCLPVNYGHYKAVPPEGDTMHGIFRPERFLEP